MNPAQAPNGMSGLLCARGQLALSTGEALTQGRLRTRAARAPTRGFAASSGCEEL
jgi:hypothetical protein